MPLASTHALKPSAAAGRVPAPLIEVPALQFVEASVPAIGTPPMVHDQLALELRSPEHFRLQVYGRSPMKPVELSAAASAAGRGATGAPRSVPRASLEIGRAHV